MVGGVVLPYVHILPYGAYRHWYSSSEDKQNHVEQEKRAAVHSSSYFTEATFISLFLFVYNEWNQESLVFFVCESVSRKEGNQSSSRSISAYRYTTTYYSSSAAVPAVYAVRCLGVVQYSSGTTQRSWVVPPYFPARDLSGPT